MSSKKKILTYVKRPTEKNVLTKSNHITYFTNIKSEVDTWHKNKWTQKKMSLIYVDFILLFPLTMSRFLRILGVGRNVACADKHVWTFGIHLVDPSNRLGFPTCMQVHS